MYEGSKYRPFFSRRLSPRDELRCEVYKAAAKGAGRLMYVLCLTPRTATSLNSRASKTGDYQRVGFVRELGPNRARRVVGEWKLNRN